MEHPTKSKPNVYEGHFETYWKMKMISKLQRNVFWKRSLKPSNIFFLNLVCVLNSILRLVSSLHCLGSTVYFFYIYNYETKLHTVFNPFK